MSNIKFSDYKEKIQSGLTEKLQGIDFVGETQGFTLIDGFFNLPIQTELSGSLTIGGPTVPMVAIVGNKTGRVYYFAIKAIVPEVEI